MANTKNAKTLTVEVHSTEKTVKATGNKFRSYFATAVGGEELKEPMSVIFVRENSGGKPRAEHAILTIDPLISSSYGKDKHTGKTAIYISDPYIEREIKPKKKGVPLCKPSEWTDGNKTPAGGKDDEGVKGQVEFEEIDGETVKNGVENNEELPF